MGDEFLDNIRQGDWLLDYTAQRIASELDRTPGLTRVCEYMHEVFGEIKQLPNSFKPRYACRVVEKIFNAAISCVLQTKMDTSLLKACPDPFLQQLVPTLLLLVMMMLLWNKFNITLIFHICLYNNKKF